MKEVKQSRSGERNLVGMSLGSLKCQAEKREFV